MTIIRAILLVSAILPSAASGTARAAEAEGSIISPPDPLQYDMDSALEEPPSMFVLTWRDLDEEERFLPALQYVFDGKRIHFRGRLEPIGDGQRFSYHARCRALSGKAGCDAGYFLPDLAMGLSFAGYSITYPFSSGYPLRKPRTIVGRTSFYGRPFFGGAANARVAGLDVLCFLARPGRWRENEFVPEEDCVSGIRLARKTPILEAGMTVWNSGGCLMAGLDGRRMAGKTKLAAEISFAPGQAPAVICGLTNRDAPVNVGLAAYAAPRGRLESSGDLPGGRVNSCVERRGLSLVLDRRIARGLKLRYAFAHDLFEETDCRRTRNTSRAGVTAGRKGVEMRIDWTCREDFDIPTIPFPPLEEPASSTSRDLKISMKSGPSGRKWRLSAQYPSSDESSGFLISPAVALKTGSGRSRLDISCAWYRSFRGSEGFYRYEPVAWGGYPWKYLGGRGGRTVIRGEIRRKGLKTTARGMFDTGEGYGLDVQFLFEF